METTSLYELGTFIKNHRERLGLVRDDLAMRIKVSAKTLHAIEEGLGDSLPQPVYTVGFIRAYTQAMGMDQDEVNALILKVYPATAMDNIRPDLSSSAREQSISINRPSVNKTNYIIVAVVALILLAVGAWLYIDKFVKTSEATDGKEAIVQSEPGLGVINEVSLLKDSAETLATSQVTAAAEAEAPVAAQQSQSQNQSQSSPTGSSPLFTPAVEASPQTSAPASTQVQAVVLSPPAEAAAADTAPVAPGVHRVALFATADCWVEVRYDGNSMRNFLLEAGDNYTLRFRDNLWIKLGNAGGVTVSYNNQRVQLGARQGEVKILTFPPGR